MLVMFVDQKNTGLSREAALILNQMSIKAGVEIDVDSAGTDVGYVDIYEYQITAKEKARVAAKQFSIAMGRNSDKIYIFDYTTMNLLRKRYKVAKKKITVIKIINEHTRKQMNQSEIEQSIKEAMEPLIEELRHVET
jgi:protein-tyrosine-phosphatase